MLMMKSYESVLCQPRAGGWICIFSGMEVIIRTQASNSVVGFYYYDLVQVGVDIPDL